MAQYAKALQIMVPSGKGSGLKIVTVPGWSGRCFVVPRQDVKALKTQPASNKPGLYILFGQDSEAGKRLAYIGESENFFSRITTHDAAKDFWDTAVIFTGGLNRAYVKYLEHLATMLANKVNRMEMQNKVQPQENSLSDFDKLAVEQYFDTMQFVLSALNYEIFESLEDSVVGTETYHLQTKNTNAKARLLDNGSMLVLAGSTASTTEAASYSGWTKDERHAMIADGRLAKHGETSYILTEDMLFKSPSAAAAIMAGRSINGWTAWKDSAGNTLDQNLRT